MAFNSGNGPEQGRDRTLELLICGWNEGNTGRAAGAARAARRVVWDIHHGVAVGTVELAKELAIGNCTRAYSAPEAVSKGLYVGRKVVMQSKDGQW